MTSAERAAALKARRKAQGLVQCNVWVPAEAVADIMRAAELIRQAHAEGRELSVARLVDSATGRLSGLRKAQ